MNIDAHSRLCLPVFIPHSAGQQPMATPHVVIANPLRNLLPSYMTTKANSVVPPGMTLSIKPEVHGT